MECNTTYVEKCHYTHITQYDTINETVCEETYEKICQLIFKKEPIEETVQTCHKPLVKICDGTGEEVCTTEYESSCTTKYEKDNKGKIKIKSHLFSLICIIGITTWKFLTVLKGVPDTTHRFGLSKLRSEVFWST